MVEFMIYSCFFTLMNLKQFKYQNTPIVLNL